MESQQHEKNNLQTKFTCQRCGKCCMYTALNISAEEVEQWKKRGNVPSNYPIYSAISFACIFEDEPGSNSGPADLFLHPITGEELDRCPFLRKLPNQKIYRCLIHNTIKPKICQEFPFDKDGNVYVTKENICPEAARLAKLKSTMEQEEMKSG